MVAPGKTTLVIGRATKCMPHAKDAEQHKSITYGQLHADFTLTAYRFHVKTGYEYT